MGRFLLPEYKGRKNMITQEEQDRIISEVEKLLRKAQKAGANLDERSFLRGAMAGFLAVYGEGAGHTLPLAPPKWVFAEMEHKSIFRK